MASKWWRATATSCASFGAADGFLHEHGRPLANIGDVGAGQSLGRAGEIGGEAVRRQAWVHA